MIATWSRKLIEQIVGWRGYELRPARRLLPLSMASRPYNENSEVGAVNMKEKLARQARGGPFEWPDILALNRTVATMIGEAKRIVELGSGTGAFAWEVSTDPDVHVLCSEFDADAHAWAVRNRSRPNIRYVTGPVAPEQGPFDLLVTIEVVEHVSDYAGFLDLCCSLAPRAIITTPNKMRTVRTMTSGPPAYYQHVREWTAGEFYWVLRAFYREVRLFGMPDPNGVGAVPMDVTESLSPLIAVCAHPRLTAR
jgi:hypothetical protein